MVVNNNIQSSRLLTHTQPNINTIISGRVRKLVSATLIQPWIWPIITAPKVSKRLKSQGRRLTWSTTTTNLSCASKQVVFGYNVAGVASQMLGYNVEVRISSYSTALGGSYLFLSVVIEFSMFLFADHTGICRMHSLNLHKGNQFCFPKSETYRYRSSSPVYPVSLSSLPKSLSRWSL